MSARGHHGLLLLAGGSPPTSSYDSVVTAAAPAIWYRLNETSGTSAADSAAGGARPGAVQGTWTFADAGVSVAAPAGFSGLGRGLDLSATPSGSLLYQKTPADTLVPMVIGANKQSSSWTAIIWMTGSAKANQYLVDRQNDAAIIYQFVSDQVEFYSGSWGTSDPRPGSQIPLAASDTTTPHMIVYRYAAGQWTGFKDNIKVFDMARSFGCGSNAQFRVGDEGGGNVSKSRMFDIQCYARAVTDAEIAAMWAARDQP